MAEMFNKVKQGIGKSVSAVSIKSKEVLEGMKIKNQMDSLQKQINIAITELGQMVYSMFTQGNLDQAKIDEKCQSIVAIDQQLSEKNLELTQLHLETGEALGKVYCGNCKAEVSPDSLYCGQCGQKMP